MDNAAPALTDEQIRDCYYVMRAMHDGACPQCGHVADGATFEWNQGYQCPKCCFQITGPELAGIRKLSARAVARRLTGFHAARAKLAELGNANHE